MNTFSELSNIGIDIRWIYHIIDSYGSFSLLPHDPV